MIRSRIVTFAAFVVYGTAMLVPSVYPQLFPHRGVPAWLRYTTVGVLIAPLVVLVALVVAGVEMRLAERPRPRRVVREAPAATGIQVLGTFLDEGTDHTDERTADHYGQDGAR